MYGYQGHLYKHARHIPIKHLVCECIWLALIVYQHFCLIDRGIKTNIYKHIYRYYYHRKIYNENHSRKYTHFFDSFSHLYYTLFLPITLIFNWVSQNESHFLFQENHKMLISIVIKGAIRLLKQRSILESWIIK